MKMKLFQIPYVVIAEQAKELYKTTLTAYAGGQRILTVEEKANLDKMKDFLSMEQSAVDDIHSEVRRRTSRVPAVVLGVVLFFGILTLLCIWVHRRTTPVSITAAE